MMAFTNGEPKRKEVKILKIQYTEIFVTIQPSIPNLFFFFGTFFLHTQGNQSPEVLTSDLLSQFARDIIQRTVADKCTFLTKIYKG